MGLLDRWDRRNQRTADFEMILEREDPNWWKRQAMVVAALAVVGLTLDLLGSTTWGRWVAIPVGALAIAAFAVYCVAETRKYRALRARHERRTADERSGRRTA